MRLEQAYFSEQNHYETLDLSPEATSLEIEQAYRLLAEDLNLQHPVQSQRAMAAEKMLQLTQAYEILNTPMQRSRYDLQIYGRESLPISPAVNELFREAMSAFRKRKSDLALRYFKELTKLYPHRSLYRVHLAISYADKKWLTFSEVELETALRLDPKDEFAKETIAKLLFKLPDRKRKGTFAYTSLNQQVVMLTAAICFLGIALASGLPQKFLGSTLNQLAHMLVPYEKKTTLKNNGLPQDMVTDLRHKQTKVNVSSVRITKFADSYMPDSSAYDYTKRVAKQKTFYANQSMVVITYEDGSILTYKPQNLKGWKLHKGSPVMITKDNELIPSPTLPLMLPDGTKAQTSAPGFPQNLFPEYFGDVGSSPSTPVEAPPSPSTPTENTPPPVQTTPTENTPTIPAQTTPTTTTKQVSPPVQNTTQSNQPYSPYNTGGQ